MKALLIFLFCLPLYAKTIVISDVDNTIKRLGEGSIKFAVMNKLRNKDEVYPTVRTLFQSLYLFDKAEFFYLSLSLEELSSIEKWLIENQFPPGVVSQRTLDSTFNSKKFKKDQLIKFLKNKNLENTKILFWGDNQEFDVEVYQEVARELKLKDYTIYIRDMTTHDTFWGMDLFIVPRFGIKFFLQDLDLFNMAKFPEFIGRVNYFEDQIRAKLERKHQFVYQIREKLAVKLYYAYCLKDRTPACKKMVRKRTLELMSVHAIKK